MLWRVDQVQEVAKHGVAHLQVIAMPAEPTEQNMHARLSMFVPVSEQYERGDVLELGIKVPTGF